MAEVTLNRILQDLDSLELQELKQVGEAVEARLRSEDVAKRRDFHQDLLAAGLVRQFKPPRSRPLADRRPVEMVGRPISETLIEERR